MSKYSHLSGGAPSNVRSTSKGSVPRLRSKSRSASRIKPKSAVMPARKGAYIPTDTSFGNTITNITLKKGKKPSMLPLDSKRRKSTSKGMSHAHSSIVSRKSRSKSKKKPVTRNQDIHV